MSQVLNKFKDAAKTLLSNGIMLGGASYSCDDFVAALFILMYDKLPQVSYPRNYYPNRKVEFNPKINALVEDFGERANLPEISIETTYNRVAEAYPDKYDFIEFCGIAMLLADECIIFGSSYPKMYASFEGFPQEFMDNIVFLGPIANQYMYYLVYDRGYEDIKMPIKIPDGTIEECYNDDLPHEKVLDILNSKDSGIILFNSIPGCGKTYYIRHLMSLVKKDFLYLEGKTLEHLEDKSFLEVILGHKDSIIILEDCEDLLKNRGVNNNSLSTLLNISDGLLGDGLSLKFICTFNTNLKDIDPAILRKGRTRLKYTFDKLSSDKAYLLGQKLGKNIPKGISLTLSEIYNYNEDTGMQERNKLGF